MTQESITPYTTSPFYWPFIVQLHSKSTGGGAEQYYISVEALDIDAGVPKPPSSDSNSSDRTGDLYPRIALPEGIVLLDPADNSSLTDSWITNRPMFWKKTGNDDFVTGAVVGGSNGIAVCDALDDSIRVEIIIDPIYGTLTIKDKTR